MQQKTEHTFYRKSIHRQKRCITSNANLTPWIDLNRPHIFNNGFRDKKVFTVKMGRNSFIVMICNNMRNYQKLSREKKTFQKLENYSEYGKKRV